MTEDERSREGAEEQIEDLEPPAGRQEEVAGGEMCAKPTTICVEPTCIDTVTRCIRLSLQKEQHLA